MLKLKHVELLFGPLVGFAAACGCWFVFGVHRPHAYRPPDPVRLAVSDAAVIGPRPVYSSGSRTPYVLVEFGDYQCPPCRKAYGEVRRLLAANPGKLCTTFRHYPLTRIHPQAMPAAIVAETARRRGRFWPVHDGLYSADGGINADRIRAIQRELDRNAPSHGASPDVEKVAASRAVSEDIAAGKKLGVRGTPSFFHCLPDHSVIQLGELAQAKRYLG